ncbi:MAG: FAD-dependent oxidoreductase [Candidatus Midichloria sp.]|nr:MAG: FAD-dependent oxidoreductase [Candidatus Midichloria sp.]
MTTDFAELVCSNSLRSDDVKTAVGLLHEEMKRAGSSETVNSTKTPAGPALAVDRVLFSNFVTEKIKVHPLISIKNEEVKSNLLSRKSHYSKRLSKQ